MMTRRALGGFVVAAGMLLGVRKKSSWVYRYRLAAEVETPEGPKTGSGVIEVRRVVAPWPLSYVDLSHGAMTIVAKGEREGFSSLFWSVKTRRAASGRRMRQVIFPQRCSCGRAHCARAMKRRRTSKLCGRMPISRRRKFPFSFVFATSTTRGASRKLIRMI